jgi:hypothetical protein
MHATGERISHPPDVLPPLDPSQGEVCTVLQLLRSPQPTLMYGLYRTESLKTTILDGPPFDFSDLALLTEVALCGGIRFIPEVLFHAGVAGAAREPYSVSRRRLPGFKLSYGRYARSSMRAIIGAHSLSFRDRFRLSYALLRQIMMLAHWHEWSSRRSR